MPKPKPNQERMPFSGQPPEVYLNPWVCTTHTAAVVATACRALAQLAGRRRQIRLLKRIPVLPVGWDAAGRHTSRG